MRNKKTTILDNRGFTLIEIMVVIVIIGIMAAFIGPNVLGAIDKSRVTKAVNDMKVFSGALKTYYIDNSVFPTTEQGLRALIEQPASEPVPMAWQPRGYLDLSAIPLDPWGSPYIYRSPGDNNEDFVIISLGADRREGGEGYSADIRSTDR